MSELRWQLTRAQAAALTFALAFGMAFFAVLVQHYAKAELRHPDPYSGTGWFEMLQADEEIAVRWNPTTGESWALACPNPAKTSCEWDPIEFRGGVPTGSSGWYDAVLTAQGVIYWHVHTGQSWILACPGAINTCDWEPLEVRP